MIVALDVGNTSLSMGGFQGEALIFHAKMATLLTWTEDQYAIAFRDLLTLHGADAQQIEGVILSSVVPGLTNTVKRAMGKLTDCAVLLVSAGIRTGLNIKTDFPRQVGTDLVSAAVWANQSCPMPCVLVLLETATTFVLLDQSGQMMGTAITAGVQLSMDALHERCAQLPSVGIEPPAHGVVGRNTADALRSGAVYGAAAMVDGMIARLQEAVGQPVYAAATGLHAAAVVPYCQTGIVLEETMILKGLAAIWRKNHRGS